MSDDELRAFVQRGQAAQREVDRIADTSSRMSALTADDKRRLTAMMDAKDPEQLVRLIFNYYDDLDRAERVSRDQMYLQIGLLCGVIMRLVDATPKMVSWGDTREKAD